MDTLFAEPAVQSLCEAQWTAIEVDDRVVLREGRHEYFIMADKSRNLYAVLP